MTPEDKLDQVHEIVLGLKPVVEDSATRIKGIEQQATFSSTQIGRHDEKLIAHEVRIKKSEENIDGVGSVFREHERDSKLHSHSVEEVGFFLKLWFLFLQNWKLIALTFTFAISILNFIISFLHKIPTIPIPNIPIGGLK